MVTVVNSTPFKLECRPSGRILEPGAEATNVKIVFLGAWSIWTKEKSHQDIIDLFENGKYTIFCRQRGRPLPLANNTKIRYVPDIRRVLVKNLTPYVISTCRGDTLLPQTEHRVFLAGTPFAKNVKLDVWQNRDHTVVQVEVHVPQN